MNARPNILVVCGRNKRRSRTAEYIFKNDNRFNIRSAGLSPKSEKRISIKDILWAHHIFVMEREHKNRTIEIFGNFESPTIEVLDIEDEFDFKCEELIELLTEKINSSLLSNYKI